METPRVLAVVLSFNGTADTIECLESLTRQTYANLSILVVDNASTDGAQQAISTRFPDIELLTLPINRGWAGGNNAGIRIAQARHIDLVCLLNNDLLLADDVIERLAVAYRDLEPCLLHPGIYFYDNPTSAQLDPSIDGNSSQKIPTTTGHDAWEMDHAYGACLMISTSIFHQIGLFDERFFLQLEETDFFMRAHRVGIRALCLPAARVLHKESASFGGIRTPVKTYYSVRNQLLLIEKHAKPGSGKCWTALKRLYWQLRNLHREVRKTASGSFTCWLVSAGAHATAIRRAFLDYLYRRFDRISDKSAEAIASRLK